MADDSWRDLELWDRVKWARSQRYDSASAAAEAMGMKEGTYRCYERGPDSAKFIKLDYHHAQLFAREFKVRWEWLLHGSGQPWLTGQGEEDEVAPATNNLRAWREFRGLTAAELAKKANTTAQIIADLESGAMELSQKWLMALAPALDTTQGRLLDYDPEDVDQSILETFRAIPKEQRGQALEILKTFKPYRRLR
jgi:transcriptional regulator with XRE-family HTH domain